jgi:MFS family permease
VGWGFLILANMAGTLLQTLAPEELRGRVTGVYSLVAFGSLPIGGLLAGALAGWIGLPLTIILGAVAMLLFAACLYLFVPQLRHVE